MRILAAERGHVVTRDALIEALWGEQLPADPATNLNVVVNRARRALGEPDTIQTAEGGYVLRGGPEIVVDVEQFENRVLLALEAHSRGDLAAASSSAQAAMQLWDNPYPEDAYAGWARVHRDRLERLYLDALEVAATARLSIGNAREAVNLAAEAVARQPLREAAHVLLIRAHAADGDQAAAVSAYLDLRRILADELGIDPSLEAVALYQHLLRGTLPTRVGRPQPRRRGDLPPLVGRDPELELLGTVGDDNRIALVSGRSGSGKSRLLEGLSARIERPVLPARAVLPEREKPWSLARALLQTATATTVDVAQLLGATTLSALRDVLPELDAPEVPVDSPTRRALILQGLVRIIEATAPSLVVVDDLEWADSSSLDMLALVTARSLDVAMVFAYRAEAVADDSPVGRFLNVIAEARPVEIPLRPLDADALQRLVASAPVAAALAEHTDGTPFAVLQAARALESEGMLRRNTSGGWDVLAELARDRVREVARAGQRDMVWRQFERQPREGRARAANCWPRWHCSVARRRSASCLPPWESASKMP